MDDHRFNETYNDLFVEVNPNKVKDLLNKAVQCHSVDDGIHYLVTVTGIRDLIALYLAENIKEYESKKKC